MHYYKFSIGDYASHTRHLSHMEDLAYRRLLDLAYSTELPLQDDIHTLSRLINMREYQIEILDVLKEFFDLVPEGWIHGRVLKEIEDASSRKSKAKEASISRWERQKHAKQMLTQCSLDASSINNDASSTKNDATHNPLPITHNLIKTPLEFDTFWKAYPKKVGKPDCLKIWNRKKPPFDQVMKTLDWQKKTKQWLDGYIPNPSTYLNQGRWLDEQTEEQQPKKAWE